MIAPKQEIVLERTDKMTGTGLCRQELGNTKEESTYSIYGIIARFLTSDFINEVAKNMGALTQKQAAYSQNENMQKYSDGIGYLASEGTKIGLTYIKYIADKYDKFIPLKGIIQLMRYCTEEQKDSFILDATVAEVIATLPIKNDVGYRIYVSEPIRSINEINKIKYSDFELEHLGFLLYFMTRAKCSVEELKYKRRLQECLNAIGMSHMISDYESQYLIGAGDKTRQVMEVCSSFQNFGESNIKFKGKYFSKVLKKLSYYMPADCDIQRQSLVIASQGMDALMDKDPILGVNVAGQAGALIMDSKRMSRDKDNIKDDWHRYLVRKAGLEGNFVSSKVMPASEEIGGYFDDLEN